jgi:hypothetical protein
LAAVTNEEISTVAKKYLKSDNISAIIVSDQTKIEPALWELPLGKTLKALQFDDDFRLAPAKQ